jgi:hypothetical protein
VVGFEDFGYEVIKKGGDTLGCHLMRGMEAASLRLHPDAGGRWSVARGAAANRGAAARSEEGDDLEGGLGRSGPRRAGDAHWAGA